MGHYAKVENGIVTDVIVAQRDFIDTQEGTWVKTSRNTHAGEHDNGGTPLCKNFAIIGGLYDEVRNAFYEEQPYESFILNEGTCLWEPPIAYPEDYGVTTLYEWNEDNLTWSKLND
tara:strand:+ start:904 stop:1251 length:348 start_codon:yes stop_codon:yes gene_type:complete